MQDKFNRGGKNRGLFCKGVSKNVNSEKEEVVKKEEFYNDTTLNEANSILAMQLEICAVEPPRGILELEALMCNYFEWIPEKGSVKSKNVGKWKVEETEANNSSTVYAHDAGDRFFFQSKDAEEFNYLKSAYFSVRDNNCNGNRVFRKVRSKIHLQAKEEDLGTLFDDNERTDIFYELKNTSKAPSINLENECHGKLVRFRSFFAKIFSNIYWTPKKSRPCITETIRYADSCHVLYDLGCTEDEYLDAGKNSCVQSKMRKILKLY